MTTETRMLQSVPRVNGVPVLGVLPRLWRDPLAFFLRTGTENPRIAVFQIGPATMYLAGHPDSVKYLLQDNNKNYVKGYDTVKPLLGDGLVTSEGELWRRQRRLMQPAFHRQRIAELLPLMTGSTEIMLNGWRSRPAGQPLNLAHELMLLTQNIIVRTMFSADVSGRAEEIAEAFATVMQYLNSIMFTPIPHYDKLPTPTNLRFRKAMQFIDSVVYGLIRERRASGVQRNDLLQMLMDAREEGTGEGMSERQMHDEILTIFLAGHETTATLLSWTFYLLGQHPEAEERMRAEFAEVLVGRNPGFEDVGRLSYTRQVIDETLRLYPPAWMFARQAVADDEIGGYHIPARSMIVVSPYVTHHLPEFWPEPFHFDPERFAPGADAGQHRYAYFPFGGGPRLCIGNNFALMEAPIILSMIMQNFRLRPVEGADVRISPRATLRLRPGLPVYVEAV